MTESGKLVAMLFYSSDPIASKQLCKTFGVSPAKLSALIKTTNKDLEQLGLNIVEGPAVILTTQAGYAGLIEEFYQTAPQPLSQAALEVLSIIAYRQPINKIEIDEIRGVSSEQSIRNLLNKQLIKKSIKNNQTLYQTTTEFLQAMGIKNIKDLPKPDATTT